LQEYKGVFCGQFVLRTFAAHLNAIRGAIVVRNLPDAEKADRGGLVLAAVSVRVGACFHHTAYPLFP
jgi:hypothetical protein